MDRTEIVHLLTTEQAVALVKKVDRENLGKFALSIRQDAQIVGEDGKYFQGALATYLPVSRKQALGIVKSLLSATLEARGARITIREVSFPGAVGDCRPTYWIG